MERKFKAGHTTYQRSSYGVGKKIGSKLYIHKDYIKYLPEEFQIAYENAKRYANIPDSSFRCVVFDFSKVTVRFDEAPDFDTAREPIPGNFVLVDTFSGKVKRSPCSQIWHHKWMWVGDDYQGFDVDESYQWSKLWTSRISHPSGFRAIWDNELKAVGLDT